MYSPALGMAYGIWRRQPWTLSLLVGHLLLLPLLAPLPFIPTGVLGSGVAVALLLTVMLIPAFTYSSSAGIEAPESVFPRCLLTLPASSRALAGWPMLYGTCSFAAAWLVLFGLVLVPRGVLVPVAWPAMLLAAVLAWMQAFIWSPFPWRLMRPIALLIIPPALAMMNIPLQVHHLHPMVLATAYAAAALLAYPVAVTGVSAARRGAWTAAPFSSLLLRGSRVTQPLAEQRKPFASPALAQLWLEWRTNGTIAPIVTAASCLSIFLLAVVYNPYHVQSITPRISINGVLVALVVIPLSTLLICACCGPGFAYWHGRRRSMQLPAFLATRPISTSAMLIAKLKAMAISTLVAWLISLAVLVLCLLIPGRWISAAELLNTWIWDYYSPKAVLCLVLAVVALVLTMPFTQLRGLAVGLTGRNWAVAGASLPWAALPVALPILGHCLMKYPAQTMHVLRAAQSALWIILLIKLALAAWAARSLLQHHLVAPRLLLLLAASWCALAAAIFATAHALIPASALSSAQLLLLTALFIPLARPALAPLSLHWNRHR